MLNTCSVLIFFAFLGIEGRVILVTEFHCAEFIDELITASIISFYTLPSICIMEAMMPACDMPEPA